jgi:hypothetical protein
MFPFSNTNNARCLLWLDGTVGIGGDIIQREVRIAGCGESLYKDQIDRVISARGRRP